MSKFIDNKGIRHKTLKQKEVAEKYRKLLEQRTGLSFETIIRNYNETQIFQLSLENLTVTSSIVSAIFGSVVPQKNSCRNKSTLEDKGLLVCSINKINCPYTDCKAHLLSCNPMEFAKLLKSNTNQLNMFE